MRKVTESGRQIILSQYVASGIIGLVITAFFVCDCEAEDGQAILVALYEAGDSEFIFSAVYEIDLHLEVDNLIGKKRYRVRLSVWTLHAVQAAIYDNIYDYKMSFVIKMFNDRDAHN